MDGSSPEKEKCSSFPKVTSEKCSTFIRNVPHAMLLRESGVPRYHNQLASELQIAAEEQLTHKQYREMKCQLPDVTRSTYLVVFSPDGKKMASSHGNHNVYVTDVKTGKNLNTLSGHPRTPWCIAFHPSSNQILASGCLGGQVRVWDLHGGSEMWTVEGQTSIASLAFHPTYRLLVVASYNEILFWDWSQPEPFAKCCTQNEKEKIRYVAFDLAGTKLITGIENPQPLQSQWDRVGPMRYIPHSGSPRGPRPIGPRPGFGPVFSHTSSSSGPVSRPASRPVSPSTPLQRISSQLISRSDERRSYARHFNRLSTGSAGRTTPTSVPNSLLLYQNERRTPRHYMSPGQMLQTPSSTATSQNGRVNSHQSTHTQDEVETGHSEDSADFVGSWMWRSQHSLPSETFSTNRFRLLPFLGRRNTEYSRLRSASDNHQRHIQILLDQCRRSFQSVQPSLSSSSSTLLQERRNEPVPQSSLLTPEYIGRRIRHSQPFSGENASQTQRFVDDLQANNSPPTVGHRNRSSRYELSSPPQQSHIERISSLTEDVQRILRILSQHISSMQQCSHCQPRMRSFRLSQILQLWTEMQSQIRALQVSIWENSSLASNAWHRFSCEAITEMLSHMSHQDRMEERLTNPSRPMNIPSEHARSSNSDSPLSSTMTDSVAALGNSLVSGSRPIHLGGDMNIAPEVDGNSTHQSSVEGSPTTPLPVPSLDAGNLLLSDQSPCPSVVSSLETSSRTTCSNNLPSVNLCVPQTDHSEIGGTERESLRITWNRNPRGRTAVGVVSRRDTSGVGEHSSSGSVSTESHAPHDTSLRSRVFRIRRRNMFSNNLNEFPALSRVNSSIAVQMPSISSDTDSSRAASEPRTTQASSPLGNMSGRMTTRKRSSSSERLSSSIPFQEAESSSPPYESSNLNLHERSHQRFGTERTESPLEATTPRLDPSASPFPLSRLGTRRMADQLSLLRCRWFLRKPLLTAYRSSRFRSGLNGHHPSCVFGSRRAVLTLAVDSPLRSQQGAGSGSPRTEGIRRTPHMLLRILQILRSLNRSSPQHHTNSIVDSSSTTGASNGLSHIEDHQNIPLSTGASSSEPINVSTFHSPPLSNNCAPVGSSGFSSTTVKTSSSNNDSSRRRWAHYNSNGSAAPTERTESESVRDGLGRVQQNSVSLNMFEGGMATEYWADRLLRLHVHHQLREQELWQRHARLHSRYSSHVGRGLDRRHRFGPCYCGRCSLVGPSHQTNQGRERQFGRGLPSSQLLRLTNDNASIDPSSFSHSYEQGFLNNSQSARHPSQGASSLSTECPRNEMFQNSTEPESLPCEQGSPPIVTSNHSGHLSVETPSASEYDINLPTASTSHAMVSNIANDIPCSSCEQPKSSQNHRKRSALEDRAPLKAGSSTSLESDERSSSKLRKTSKAKELRNNTNGRRSFHQTSNRKKPSALKTRINRSSKEPRTNQLGVECAASSSETGNCSQNSNSQQSSVSQILSQLPEPTFSQQLENMFDRLEHLMFLQRDALNTAGDQSEPNVESYLSRNAGDGTRELNGSSDAISITSRLLTRLTESLVRQLQIVQHTRESHECFDSRIHHFAAQSSTHGSHHTPMTSDTRQRAEELLNVMMESLATFSRESSSGEVFPDNSVLEHIQNLSGSFWLLQGLYMSLHLALELTDVLLSHIITSYEPNDLHEESRLPFSQPCVCPTSSPSSLHSWIQTRPTYPPSHLWSQSSRPTPSSSSTSIADGRPSSTAVSDSSNSSTSQITEGRRIRPLNHVFACGLHNANNNQTNTNGTEVNNEVPDSTSTSARVLPTSLCPIQNDISIEDGGPVHGAGASSSTSSQRTTHHVRLSVPTVQVNDVPLSEINEWQSSSTTYSSSPEVLSSSLETHNPSNASTRWTSPPASNQTSPATEGGRPGSFRVRPRLLHPHYSRYSQEPFISNGDISAQQLLFHLDFNRGDGLFVREPFFSSEEHRIHRIQLWDFSDGRIPDISKADKNLVVAECKIHNDASVDVSAEGHLLVALLPISRTVLHPHLAPTVGQSVGVYSLVWESLGQLLYTTSLDQAAVSVALSPTAAYLLVGLVSRRTVLMPNDHHALAQIFRLEGARPGRPIGARGRLNLHRDIELQRDHVASSLNCIRWAPMPGQGFVYGTNTGALVMLR